MDLGTAEVETTQFDPPRGFAAWQAAWHGLPDNPIAQYLLLAEQRRRKRGLRRRNITYFLTALFLATIIIVILAGTNSVVWQWQTYADYGLAFICVLYILWLAEGVYNSVRDALMVLAPPSKLTTSLALDDTLAASSLSHEDIIAGILRILLPSLWRRGLAGSVLLWLVLTVIATEGLEVWNSDIYKLLALLPLGIGLTFLSSVISTLAFLLFYISVSQAMSVLVLSTSAVAAVIIQLAWIGLGPVLAFGELAMMNEFSGVDQVSGLVMISVGLGLSLALMSLAALRGRYFAAARSINAVLGPWLLPSLLALACFAWQVSLEFSSLYTGNEEHLIPLIIGYFQAWGFLLPFNSGSVHAALFTGIIDARINTYWQLLIIPVSFLLQLLVTAILAWAARDSVRRRRTEGAQSRW